MKTLTKSTDSTKQKNIKRKWHLIDLTKKILGRTAPHIAVLLQGKHKVTYTTYLDMGDYVVAINAQKIKVTGNKENQKNYTSYSGYPGGLKNTSYKILLENNPGKIIRNAVSGMLPKNKLRDRRLARLYIFADEKHPYGNKFKVNISHPVPSNSGSGSTKDAETSSA